MLIKKVSYSFKVSLKVSQNEMNVGLYNRHGKLMNVWAIVE